MINARQLGRYPLSPVQTAVHTYQTRLTEDEALREDSRYASIGNVDEDLVQVLRDGIAGKLSDDALLKLVGWRVGKYRHLGNTTAVFGTAEWRTAE